MDDLAFLELAARVARRVGKPASTADLVEAQALAQEATVRHRRAVAAGRPALLFKLISIGLPSFSKDGHLEAMEMTFEVGVVGGTVRRLTTRLSGAAFAWLAIAGRDGVEVALLGGPRVRPADSVRNAVRRTFIPVLSRLCPALADVLGAHLRVENGRVVFEASDKLPQIITH